MDHPEMITSDGPLFFAESSGQIRPLAEAFRALSRRRLVITGGPGTGKTTLAVQLLLELLNQTQAGEPVPVLFSLVGWSPEAQPRVQGWLTEQLEREYPALRAVGSDTARALVERGRILPILDGLDEVPAVRRPSIIAALNTSLAYDDGLILTSRRPEYQRAITEGGKMLTAAAVIAPLALSKVETAAYLRKPSVPPPAMDDQRSGGTARGGWR
jgi:predicted NACHT family NTPase